MLKRGRRDGGEHAACETKPLVAIVRNTLTTGAMTIAVAFGCTNSDSGDVSLAPPDPGGTFGIEVTVSVIGSGRVTGAPASIDCPTRCFATLLFETGSPSAKSGMQLTAAPSNGWAFGGWTFDAAQVQGRARTGETCQPYTRPAIVPSADRMNPSLTLAAGEAPGMPPAGKEGTCGGPSNLPLAYQVTATFTRGSDIADAGQDAGEDAGPPEGDLLYDRPQAGAVGRQIFEHYGVLYWQWDLAGQSAISSGATAAPARDELVLPGPQITAFDVTQVLLYGTSGALAVTELALGSTFTATLPSPSPCASLASDLVYAYCRTADEIVRWTRGGTGPVVIASKLPPGNDIAVDATDIAYSDVAGGSVYAIPLASVPDGGFPSLTTLASRQTQPTHVQLSGAYAVWLTTNGGDIVTLKQVARGGGATVTSLVTQTGIRDFALYGAGANATIYFTVVPSSARGAASILRVPMLGGTAVPVKTGLYAPGGIAVDESYVYWTNGDAKVFRTPRF